MKAESKPSASRPTNMFFTLYVISKKNHDMALIMWASSPETLSLGFPTKQVSNQSSQLQRLARKLKFRS